MKRVGVIGCGNISGIYFQNMTSMFDNLEVAACCDLDQSKAQEAAKTYGIPKVLTTEQILSDPEIDIIVNLTTPQQHYDICMTALQAGKHVYSEKPLSIRKEDGAQLVRTAREKGLYLGCAPDTFLGAGIQTCKKLIADGWIGKPVAGTAFMVCHGHESWHPAPEFYYKAGGGPMFDMGPYYLTALVNLIGPVKSVISEAATTFPTRTITSEPKRGTAIDVEVPTHITGVLTFANGALVTMIMSFDVWGAHLPNLEIYGTEGALSVPDPNCFGGCVQVKESFHDDWHDIPYTHMHSENSRGYGVSDMARAIEEGTPARASGAVAYHVLEVMHAFLQSASEGRRIAIASDPGEISPLAQG
ncbi:MAG TPA: Gfo/Idh/MocA family oxidoreductase [Candidatus Aphodoplasma excrementigallinarum]|uniref:Gfo/Idh/MocA family oxidoreductase n=1 Tax=Candidatus Aphodoplasma excrementigallinarum TaxID=2840673 RepID=A0A9D1NF72_9FIRM|nr:Gfo/Idh/MocA family oxidoreductase [Candidatus Aphodoplasma excrementigallinarum]